MTSIALFLSTCVYAMEPSTITYRLIQQESGGQTPQVSTRQATTDDFLLVIQSASGIGSLEVSPTAGVWPARMTLRLHLQGLESLELDNGRQKLLTHISSSDPLPARWHWAPRRGEGKAKADEPELLATEHPLCPSLQIVTERNEKPPSIPLRGYFQVVVPPGFLTPTTPTMTVRWIDFYR